MVWALSLLLTSFVSLVALSIPDSDKWQMQFLHVVLMLVVLSNVGVNVLQVILSLIGKLLMPSAPIGKQRLWHKQAAMSKV